MKGCPIVTLRSGSLMVNEVNGGADDLRCVKIVERTFGEGEGDKEYRVSKARLRRWCNGGAGSESGRVLS